jgi:acyl-CoA synthetase (AMP-forming)/AMP-acid ligase II
VIDSLLGHRLAAWDRRTAIVGHDGELSYADLAAAAAALAARLRAAGIEQGMRVAVQLPGGCAAAVALLGIAQTGAVVVPLQAALKGDALQALLANCEPALALATPADPGAWPCPVWRPGQEFAISDRAAIETVGSRDPARLAAIIYTSGSTGLPHGVMLSAANMAAALQAVHDYLGPRTDDVFYSALPLSSSYGLYQLVSALSLGARLVLDRSFSFPLNSLRLLAAQRATIFAAVPAQVSWVLGAEAQAAPLLQSLRIVTTAAAALPPEHALRLAAMLPRARVFAMYGQTECKRISYLDPADLAQRPASVGRGLAIQRHRIIDADGQPVAPGEAGELAVQGPHVMQGYWRDPRRSKAKLRALPGEPGIWLHTGDQFRADAEGYLYFLGRADEVLKIGGHKVSPAEIENALLELDAIAEAAVIGVADERWGQVAVAFVVLRAGASADLERWRQHCAARMARYMIPKEFKVVAQLPKTESGKIRKRDLSL